MVPAIHALLGAKAWMPATSAGMTAEIDASYVGNALGRAWKRHLEIIRLGPGTPAYRKPTLCRPVAQVTTVRSPRSGHNGQVTTVSNDPLANAESDNSVAYWRFSLTAIAAVGGHIPG